MTHTFLSTQAQEPLQHPGYEYLLGLYWMKEAQLVTQPEKTRYYLPAKALLTACSAINGYINVVGSMVDPRWTELDENTAPIRERLVRIYQSLGLPLDINQGLWKNVLQLFTLRERLGHYQITSVYGAKETTVPAIFRIIAQNYPIRMSHSIAEEAIELLLNISE